jgi:putative CocE/NonD family hydrolase
MRLNNCSLYRLAFAAASLLAVSVAQANHVRMIIKLNGSEVGENVYDSKPDGSFTSTTTLEIGPAKVLSTVSGQMSGGVISDYKSETTTPTSKMTISLMGGKISATVNGKSKTVPFIDKPNMHGGNYSPQFLAPALTLAEKSFQSNPATHETTLSLFFLDLGAVIPLKITQAPSQIIVVNGEKKTARMFACSLGGLDIVYGMDDEGDVVAMHVPTQKLDFLAEGWDALFEDPIKKFPELSQATYKVKTERGVKMKTRDGVELVCDVVRPDDGEKHPAILIRTPYGRSGETVAGAFYASRGYVLVAQDCRGREDSGGDWDPFVNEGPDGYDTIQWIADQPWSDGKVGMIGGSYDGYVQWASAVLNPPALKCIVPQVSPPDAMRNIPYDHGIFATYLDLWWSKIVAGKKTDFSTLKGPLKNPKGLTTLPLKDIDNSVLGEHLDFYQKWLTRTRIQDWKGFDFTYHLDNVTIPALNISGIWDGDEIGTHINWNTMRDLGRKNQWIVFGPWIHAFNTTHKLGDVEYGPDAIIEMDSLYLRWFDTWLKGKDVGMDKVPHVRLFVTGANKWVSLDDWPSKEMTDQTLYLTKRGLSMELGKDETTGYTYDPSKDTKIPTALTTDDGSGTTEIKPAQLKGKSYLLEKSEPFKKATAIASPFNVTLHFKTSAVDTDWFVDIVDIAPDGKIRIVGQGGKIRGSYLQGMDKVEALVPDKEYTANIVPWDFAHEFGVGHRIGLLIQSSGFPVYARNLGTMDPINTATRMVPQKNTILMGKDSPSSFQYHVLWEH